MATVTNMLQTRRPRAVCEPDLVRIEGVSTAGRCIPAGPHGESIAGDFFDILPIDASRVLIAVGDVAGHGVGAVDRMTRLRATARALAWDVTSPAEILQRLDLLQSGFEPEDIATLWLGMYNPRTGRLRYANAGHPPPVVLGLEPRAMLLNEASAPPLGTGVVGELARVDEVVLPLGAVLFAYSDGLVERPDRDLEEQLHMLRTLVDQSLDSAGSDQTLQQYVEGILTELVPDPAAARDDVCLFALRRDAGTAA